jgi:hypothetical protein
MRSVFPSLDILKMDISVPHVLGYLEEHGDRPLDVDIATTQFPHPMIGDYLTREELEIQVIFGDAEATRLEEKAAEWIQKASSNEYQAADNLERFYWTSSKMRAAYGGGNRGSSPSQSDVERRISGYKGLSHYNPEAHWRLWSDRWLSSADLGAMCGLTSPSLGVRLRRGAVLLTYPLKGVVGSSRAACAALLMHIIASDAAVRYVGLSRPIHLQNKNTRTCVQGDEGKVPFVSAGLDGTGQIVGQSDTGVDRYSCFFIDPEHPPCESSSVDKPAVDLRQRKVVQYIDYSGSSGDYAQGHGSHVSALLIYSTYILYVLP